MTAAPSSSRPASLDIEILAGFNAHQRTDKGFGPALGPSGGGARDRAFRASRLCGRAGPLRLGFRAGRSGHPGRSFLPAGPRSAALTTAIILGRDRRMAGAAARRSGGRPLAPARRSRRLLRPADRHALSAEIAVEQHLLAERRWARIGARIASSTRLIGGNVEARWSGAQDDRSDHDVQPVEATGGEEARDRIGAAFDQNAAKAALGERGEYGGRRNPSVRPPPAARSPRRRQLRPRVASPVTTSRRIPSAASTRAVAGNRPLGSTMTRAGLGPSTRRTVNCGSSAIAVPTPMTTASTSARRRCRWARPASPLM